MLGKIEADVSAESLEEIFVEQAGADQSGIKGGKLAEEIVIDAESR